MNTTWFRRLAPAIDAAILILFVAIGRDQHHLESTGVSWFLTVLWPLAAGWAVGALVTRLYTAPTRWWLRLLGTIADRGVPRRRSSAGLFTDRGRTSRCSRSCCSCSSASRPSGGASCGSSSPRGTAHRSRVR